MTLSIITINYNNAIGLETTILSIINQSVKDFEYIVIDGGSTDNSKNVIHKYMPHLDFWVSEQDKGIYNAMNKGVEHSHGDYVIFINSGDELSDNNVIEKCLPTIRQQDADFYVGTLVYKTKRKETIEVPSHITASFLIKEALPHPASFIRTERLRKRPYNEECRIVSDWFFALNEFLYHNATCKKLNVIVSKFELTGISSSNKTLLVQEKEQMLQTLFPKMLVDTFLGNDILDKTEKQRRRKIEMCFKQKSRIASSWKLFRNSAKWLLHDITSLIRIHI